MVKVQGKDYVTYEERLSMAHAAGLQSVDVELVKWDGETAICKAVVTMDDGRSASDIGDANSDNTGPNISPHRIRQASTRAKSRAFGIILNVGEPATEEFGGAPAPREEEYSSMRGAIKQTSDAKDGKASGNNSAREASQKQLNFIATLAADLYNSTSELEEEMDVKMEELTVSEASSLIDELNRKKRGESEGSMF